MMSKSTLTVERGQSENILRECTNLIERYRGEKCSERVWYKKRDASWNVNAYSPKLKSTICNRGSGWDIVGAVEDFRKSLLRFFDEELKPHSSFTNLYEVVQILDRKDRVERNEVGAIISEGGKPSDTSALDVIDERMGAFSSAELKEIKESLLLLVKRMNDFEEKSES